MSAMTIELATDCSRADTETGGADRRTTGELLGCGSASRPQASGPARTSARPGAVDPDRTDCAGCAAASREACRPRGWSDAWQLTDRGSRWSW